jgi:hypothetical protein
VPWDAWYEPNAALGGENQIFASRFVAANNIWQPEGQDRGSGVPSLNINTDKEAENPSVAGGAAVAGADPVPWVAWEEQDGNVKGSGNHDQIFVSKGVKQAAPNAPCAGFKPSANASVSNFCWQQVGLDRLAKDGGSSPTGDPTLNIDPSRNGVEPDITFTGPSDTVGWTVWYEKDPSNIGLRNNEQVFAAKIVKDANADGGFHWQAVGNGTKDQVNVLDTSGKGFGACAESTDAEDACSLNKLAGNDAEDPRVATGTLTPGGVTVPWVTWSEDVGGHHAIFVSRLVDGNHFELFNGGNPVSGADEDAGTPDITSLTFIAILLSLWSRYPARSRHHFHIRNARFRRRQHREIRIRLGLIPVADGIEIIAAIVRVAVLHGVFQVALKRHGIVPVPPVAAPPASGALGEGDDRRAVHRVREGLRVVQSAEIPAPQEVVLAPGAGDGGFALIVDEDHLVAFAPPAIRVLQHSQGHAHQVALAARFHVDVILLSVQVELRIYA